MFSMKQRQIFGEYQRQEERRRSLIDQRTHTISNVTSAHGAILHGGPTPVTYTAVWTEPVSQVCVCVRDGTDDRYQVTVKAAAIVISGSILVAAPKCIQYVRAVGSKWCFLCSAAMLAVGTQQRKNCTLCMVYDYTYYSTKNDYVKRFEAAQGT